MFNGASSFGMKLCNWSLLNPSVDVTNMFEFSNCSIECFECPTGSPTANPTGSKTSKPTAKSTDDPTGSPTRSLTANPTGRQIEGSTCTDYCGSGREIVEGDNIKDVVKKYFEKGDEKSITCLDTSTITDMTWVLSGNGDERFQSSFNTNLSCWDVSKVTDMYGMFYNARAFNNNISSWDVSSVTTMVVST